MSETALLKRYSFDNGLELEIVDVSRHYFGGYWCAAVEARCLVPLASAAIADPDRQAEIARLLGDPVPFVRQIERMAVLQDQLPAVRAELQNRLEQQMTVLVGSELFAPRYIAGEFDKRSKRTLRGIPCLL